VVQQFDGDYAMLHGDRTARAVTIRLSINQRAPACDDVPHAVMMMISRYIPQSHSRNSRLLTSPVSHSVVYTPIHKAGARAQPGFFVISERGGIRDHYSEGVGHSPPQTNDNR